MLQLKPSAIKQVLTKSIAQLQTISRCAYSQEVSHKFQKHKPLRQLFAWTLTLILTTGQVLGQDSTSVIIVNKSNVSLEVGGAGIYGSVNYEHLIFYKSDKKLLLRAGISDLPYTFNSSNTKIGIAGIYYLIGSKHHLELGLNNTLGYDKRNVFYFFPSVGYRYQKFLSKSLSFSAAFSPLIVFPIREGQFAPWAKIGIGYSFNKKNVKIVSKLNSSYTLKASKGFFLEFGTHFLASKQNSISKYRNGGNGQSIRTYSEISFPIDTSVLYINALVVNRRMFPTLSAGVYFTDHEFKTEFAYSDYKSLYSYGADAKKGAYFNSKEYYSLIGYSYSGLLKSKNKLNRATSFYTGANLMFQHKDREFHYSYWYGVGGCPCTSEDLNSNFSSYHISFIPDAGIKLGSNQKVYVKFGLRFNAVSYVYGKFSWDYKTVTDGFPQITTYRENSGSFTKFLHTGESSYFTLVDNVYFKIGFSF